MRNFLFAAAAVALVTLAVPATAGAHPVRGALPGTPFRILDRPDSHDLFGFDLGVGGLIGDDQPEELIALRFDLYGQFIVSDSVGLMFSLPLSALIITGDGNDDELGIGNIDVGGFLYVPLGRGHTTVLVRGSLVLPTASDELGGILSNFIAAQIARMNDLILAAPDLFSARLSFSLIHDAPGLTFRFDGGLDFPLASTEDNVDVDNDPLIRIGAGVAMGEGLTKIVLEVANLANSGNLDDSGDFAHQAAIGISSQQGNLILGLSASVLLDSVFDDDIDGVVAGLIFTAASTF